MFQGGEDAKMRYEKPEMEVIELKILDVITTSFGKDQFGQDGGSGDFGG